MTNCSPVTLSVVLVFSFAATPSGVFAQAGLAPHAFSGEIATPFEQQSFAEQVQVLDPGLPISDVDLGSALVFAGHDASGLRILENAANMGSADAALALGIAADARGDAGTSLLWYQQGAEQGSAAASALAARAQLYGLNTPRDFDAAYSDLLEAYSGGTVMAATDLAMAASYGWVDGAGPGDQLSFWQAALNSGDAAAAADYARYVNLGGAEVEGFSIEQLVGTLTEKGSPGDAALAWDIARTFDIGVSASMLQALEDGHRQGSLDATARLGEALAFSPVLAERQRGLDFLEEAARGGEAIAFTGLGEYYLANPDQVAGAEAIGLNNLQTGARLGDYDALSVIAEYHLQSGDAALGYDYALMAAMSGTEQGVRRAEAVMQQSCATQAQCENILVAFATSRQVDIAADGTMAFNGVPSQGFQPTYGIAMVQVPTGDTRALEEDFDLWRAMVMAVSNIFGAQPADPFADSSVSFGILDDWTAFQSAIVSAQQAADDEQIVLFVHGVHTRFHGAIMAAARLKAKANLPGIPIVYSWPAGEASRNFSAAPSDRDYRSDVNMAARNCNAFQAFLVDLTEAFQPENATLVAHSHGSELLLKAMTTCGGAAETMERVEPMVRNVIYGAPDVDGPYFAEIVPQVVQKTQRTTLYASNADFALAYSGEFSTGSPKAGMGGPKRTIVSGVDTVDLSTIAGTSGAVDGHGYLFTAPAVLDDLNAIIRHSSPPADRCLIRQVNGSEHYWSFRAACVN